MNHPIRSFGRSPTPDRRFLPLLLTLGLVILAMTTAVPAAWAQNGTIRGTVVAEGTGQPLAGVQIFIEDTQQGTLTNASGAFLIPNVPAGAHQVRAQLIGYRTSTRSATVVADEALNLTFQLGQSAIALDEVVVTGAGQATQVKKLGQHGCDHSHGNTRDGAGGERLRGACRGASRACRRCPRAAWRVRAPRSASAAARASRRVRSRSSTWTASAWTTAAGMGGHRPGRRQPVAAGRHQPRGHRAHRDPEGRRGGDSVWNRGGEWRDPDLHQGGPARVRRSWTPAR